MKRSSFTDLEVRLIIMMQATVANLMVGEDGRRLARAGLGDGMESAAEGLQEGLSGRRF